MKYQQLPFETIKPNGKIPFALEQARLEWEKVKASAIGKGLITEVQRLTPHDYDSWKEIDECTFLLRKEIRREWKK